MDASQHHKELVHIRGKDKNEGLHEAKVDQNSRIYTSQGIKERTFKVEDEHSRKTSSTSTGMQGKLASRSST